MEARIKVLEKMIAENMKAINELSIIEHKQAYHAKRKILELKLEVLEREYKHVFYNTTFAKPKTEDKPKSEKVE